MLVKKGYCEMSGEPLIVGHKNYDGTIKMVHRLTCWLCGKQFTFSDSDTFQRCPLIIEYRLPDHLKVSTLFVDNEKPLPARDIMDDLFRESLEESNVKIPNPKEI